MTETVQALQFLEKAEDLDKLPVGSTVIVKESEFGDHVAWQLTDDVLNHMHATDDDDAKPHKAWASIYYKNEHDSIDLLNLAYDKKVWVVYVHPGK